MPVIKQYDPFHLPLRTFSTLTFDLIRMKQYRYLENCFNLVERFLDCRDAKVKFALLNSFIPELYAQLHNCEWKQEVIDMFPPKLNREYYRHAGFGRIRNEYVNFTVFLN